MDTETLKAGETGVAGGSLENFKIDQTSTIAKESVANMTANSSKATGSMTSDVLDTKIAGKQGEYSTSTVAGITFSSKTKADTLNGKEVKIITIADTDTSNGGIKNQEGILRDGNTLYIALREETVATLDTAQELMDKIADFTNASATLTGTSGSTEDAINKATGLTLGAATATTINSGFGGSAASGLKMTLPVDEATGNPVNASLPLSAGNIKTGKMSAGAVETQGEYKLEIDKIFKEEDDIVTIGKEKFVAKASGADNPSAGEFSLGSSHAMYTFKLENTVAAGGANIQVSVGSAVLDHNAASGETAKSVLNQMKNKAEAVGAYVLYDEENSSITIVSKEVGSGAKVSGSINTGNGLTVSDNNSFNGLDVTAASSDADIKKAQQNNLAAAIALNANLGKDYFISNNPGTDGNIVIKEREGSGGAGKDLDKSVTVSGGGKDDSLTITNPLSMNGIQFVLVAQKDLTTAVPKGNKRVFIYI